MAWDDAAMDRIVEHNRKYRVTLVAGKTSEPKVPKEDLKGIGGGALLAKLTGKG